MPGEANNVVTAEQRRLLELVGGGLSVAEAARRLSVSSRTAERRLAQARKALGAATNAQAISRLHGRASAAADGCLTHRQREVLELVAEGLRDEEISEQLGIASSTVASLLRSAMLALGARTRTQAAAKLAEKT